MKQVVMAAMILAALVATAQEAPISSALLDHLAGKWQCKERWASKP